MEQTHSTDIENNVVVTKGQEGWEAWIGRLGGMDWEVGISRCKLLYMGWISSEVLLYSTGNYVQYPTVNLIETNMKRSVYV